MSKIIDDPRGCGFYELETNSFCFDEEPSGDKAVCYHEKGNDVCKGFNKDCPLQDHNPHDKLIADAARRMIREMRCDCCSVEAATCFEDIRNIVEKEAQDDK